MTDVDAILLSSALPFVDGVTDLNAATLNQLEVAARKGQLNGYLGIDGAGNISPPGHIFLGVDKQIAANLYSGGSSFAFSTAVNSEPQNRFTLRADGSQLYGPGGSVAPDTNLYRAGPGALKTDTDFQVGGKFVGKGAVPAGGATGQVLKKNSASDYDLAWAAAAAAGSGNEIDYAQIIAPTAAISATTEATAVTVISGNPVTYDGTMRVRVEFFAPNWTVVAGPNSLKVVLCRDGVAIGRIFDSTDIASLLNWSVYGVLFDTPPSGSHTYSVKAYYSGSNGTIQAGPGGSGNLAPAFLRVTQSTPGLPAPQPPQAFLTGVIPSTGTVPTAGSGFSYTHTAASGIYVYTFNTPFPAVPLVVVSSDTGGGRMVTVSAKSVNGFTVNGWNTATGAAADCAHEFIATSVV